MDGIKLIKCEWDGCHLNIPVEYDGKWILVTDGKSFSIERYKQDAYDNFFPCGLFEAEEPIAWMPLERLFEMLKELYPN